MIGIDKAAGLVAALGASIGVLYSGVSFIDGRYAKMPEVEQVRTDMTLTSLRLEEKILTDRVAAIQQRLWKIEDRYGEDLAGAPMSVKEEHRQMDLDIAEVHDKIKSVMDAYRHGGYQASDSYYKYERPLR